MKTIARFVCLLLIVILIATATGCGRKPAYSDININQPERRQPQADGEQPASGEAAQGQLQPGQQSANAQPSQSAPPQFRVPAFMDSVTGGVKDIPNFPEAREVNKQYGPQQGYDTAGLTLRTSAPIEKIIEFYDKALKSNGWTVVTQNKTSLNAEWNIKKGENDDGRVMVQKDPNSNLWYIVIARTQRQPEAKK